MAEKIRYNRECGHPSDNTWFTVNLNGMVKVYCLGCLFDKLKLMPCEVYNSVEEFIKAQGGK